MTLFYVPLEGYKERYTMQWSAPVTGWLERRWRQAKVPYVRIDPPWATAGNGRPQVIKTGAVVDGVGRSTFCFHQIADLLQRAERGDIKSSDVILFDDFWTPGFEALPYAFHLLGVKPRMYAFLHAQSVDEFDFTHPMRGWMRYFERGIGTVLDGVLTSCPTLKDLIVYGGIAPAEKVHVTGHPFCSEEVMERMPKWYQTGSPQGDMRNKSGRDNTVIWSSRWDKEKDPLFFLAVIDNLLGQGVDATFKVCTSAPALKSNRTGLLSALNSTRCKYPGKVLILEGLTKEAYYEELCKAKIQFNCALQDFVPITLQEASVAGCYPLYPYFRAMPETFRGELKYLYGHKDVSHAANLIEDVLNSDDLWTREELEKRAWIHKRFDVSWLRMLKAMNVDVPPMPHDPIADKYLKEDPFASRA